MMSEAQKIVSLLPSVKSVQPPPREETIISMLIFLHEFGIRSNTATRTALVHDVFDLTIEFTDTAKYSYYVSLTAYRVLMAWFIFCNFNLRQHLVKQCLPLLYDRMQQADCTMAETAIDFVS